jgi:hypothetical protein
MWGPEGWTPLRDTELYRRILGLEKPWSFSKVELNFDAQQVDVRTDFLLLLLTVA